MGRGTDNGDGTAGKCNFARMMEGTSPAKNRRGVVPPLTESGGGRGPRIRESWSGGGGCLRSAWITRSPRPMCTIGRTDRFVSTVGATTPSRLKLQWKRRPKIWNNGGRPERSLRSIGPIIYSAVREVGGRGVTDFFGGRGYPRAFFRNCRVAMRSFFLKTRNFGELFSKSPMTIPGNF